jgi:hypothetical protein
VASGQIFVGSRNSGDLLGGLRFIVLIGLE